jgi:hypothetical protein
MDMTDGQGDGGKPDKPSDRPPVRATDDAGSRWISLSELAGLLGISRASASKLARRNRWRSQTNNQGHVLMLVPADALMRPADKPQDSPRDSAADMSDGQATDITAVLDALGEAHARETAALREARDAAQALVNRTLTQLAEERARTEQAEQRAQAAIVESVTLRERAAIAVQRTEAAERRAERAEQEMAEERARADKMRKTLETTHDVLTSAERRAAREAQDAVVALRRAETERKARGLLARLRDAWEGK